MARIPIVPVETGPIIGPALHTANVIREGRARASIAETQAANYPEEQKRRMSILDEQVKQAPMATEEKRLGLEEKKYESGRKKQTDVLEDEVTKLNMAKGLMDYSTKIMEDVTDPKEYMRRRDMAIKSNPALEGLIDPLKPEEMTEEGYMKARERETQNKGKLDADLMYKYKELQTRENVAKTQERVAKIYSDRQARDYSQLTGTDKRAINSSLYNEWFDENTEQYETGELDINGNPKQAYRLRKGADPFTKAWRDQRYKENIERLTEKDTPDGNRKKFEYQ